MLRIYLGFYSDDSILGEHSKIHLSYSVLHRAYLASFSSFVLASCLIHWFCLCWHVNSALSEHPAFTGEPNAKTGTRARTRMWLVIFISNPPYRFCWLCYPTIGPRLRQATRAIQGLAGDILVKSGSERACMLSIPFEQHLVPGFSGSVGSAFKSILRSQPRATDKVRIFASIASTSSITSVPI